MFNPNMTPEQFQQAMEGARQGVQQLAREKEIANSRLGHDELTLEDVSLHLALFKRLIAIVDDVLAVVEDTGDGYEEGQGGEEGEEEGEEGAGGFDNDTDGESDNSDNMESVPGEDEK